MVLKLADWSVGNQPGQVLDMTASGAWDRLAGDYTHPRGDRPLERVFEIARQHGVVNIVRETRYIDADWRSQLARFYNGAFRRYPSVCHRLHFFTGEVPRDLVDLSGLQSAYRGYTIIRPLPLSPVGRTMIAPPPELDDGVRCEVTEKVDIFGWPFDVTAMPFISQDTQFLRCAHAALWMVLAHARRAHGLAQRLPGDIHDAATGGVMVGRQLPSDGLSAYQLFAAMERLGLSPTRKNLPGSLSDEQLAGNLRLYAMACRYINSSLPPIAISNSHAWVLVAYRRTPSAGNPVIQLWRHDDARGPYLVVDNPWDEPEDAHRPWESLYLPLVAKAHVDAERAEVVGRSWQQFFERSTFYTGSTLEAAQGRTKQEEQATVRTFLVTSTAFKQSLTARGVPSDLAAAYRLAPMSRYIWVIEIIDRLERQQGNPDVIGEIVLDATLTQFEPLNDPSSVLALHVDNFAFLSGVDGSAARRIAVPNGMYYRSACPAIQ